MSMDQQLLCVNVAKNLNKQILMIVNNNNNLSFTNFIIIYLFIITYNEVLKFGKDFSYSLFIFRITEGITKRVK